MWPHEKLDKLGEVGWGLSASPDLTVRRFVQRDL